MSTFCTAFLVKKPVSNEFLLENSQNIKTTPESERIIFNWSDDVNDDLFEIGHYYTVDLSEELGDVIFVCSDESNDQMEYEHSINGKILRKLSWISNGGQSTWAWIEGDAEPWEDTIIFSDTNFSRASEMLKYDEHSNYIKEDKLQEKKSNLKHIWSREKIYYRKQVSIRRRNNSRCHFESFRFIGRDVVKSLHSGYCTGQRWAAGIPGLTP